MQYPPPPIPSHFSDPCVVALLFYIASCVVWRRASPGSACFFHIPFIASGVYQGYLYDYVISILVY